MTEGNTCSGPGQQEIPSTLTPQFSTQPVPQTSRNESFQFYDRKHRIRFTRIRFSSNFPMYDPAKDI